MFTKTDLKNIDELIQKRLKSGLTEFFETLVLPYFEHNEKDHKEIKEYLEEHLKDYGKRISKLEAIQKAN